MAREMQLKTAIEVAAERERRRTAQRAFMLDLDEQLAAALARIEARLDGVDVHKQIAEDLTDDEERAVRDTQVHDWLSRRNGRRPPGELIAWVYDRDAQFAAWWNRKTGYSTPEKLVQIPDAELARRYRAALLQFGERGAELDRQVRSAPQPTERK